MVDKAIKKVIAQLERTNEESKEEIHKALYASVDKQKNQKVASFR